MLPPSKLGKRIGLTETLYQISVKDIEIQSVRSVNMRQHHLSGVVMTDACPPLCPCRLVPLHNGTALAKWKKLGRGVFSTKMVSEIGLDLLLYKEARLNSMVVGVGFGRCSFFK